MRILVVDDDPVVRLFLASVLESLNHEVVSCSDGDEAWRCYCQQPAGIVISDWRMPARDGLELCRLIRQTHAHRTYFMLCSSACGSEESRTHALSAGVDGIIHKPVDGEQLGFLLERVGRNLGSKAHAAS